MNISDQLAVQNALLEQAVYQASLSTTGLAHDAAVNDTISIRKHIAELEALNRQINAIPARNKAKAPIARTTANPLLITGLPPVRGIPSSAKKLIKGDKSYYLAADGTVIPANT